MGELLLQLEQLPAAASDAANRQRAEALLGQLWPLLEQITEQIMTNTTFADDN